MRMYYGLDHRPISVGSVPTKGLVSFSEKPHLYGRYGTVCYDRRLTDDEIEQYELVDIEKAEQLSNEMDNFIALSYMIGQGKTSIDSLRPVWDKCRRLGASNAELLQEFQKEKLKGQQKKTA